MDELCACTDSERQIFEYRNSEGMHRIAYRELCILQYGKDHPYGYRARRKGIPGQISDVEKRTGDYFLKIHKSFLINRAYVECYRYDMVRMKNQTELSISKVNRKRVRSSCSDRGTVMNIHLLTYLTNRIFWFYTVYRYNSALYVKAKKSAQMALLCLQLCDWLLCKYVSGYDQRECNI